MSASLRLLVVSLFTLALCAACAEPQSGTTASGAATDVPLPADHRFEIRVGERLVRMRLAVRGHEQQRGLMYVREMPADEGMIFVYPKPQRMSFWMRNTYIPLDIGFFDAGGTLLEVHPMYPHVEDPVPSVSNEIRYALEMNQGWYAASGVTPDAKLDLEALRDALRRRGFDPKTYVGGADAR